MKVHRGKRKRVGFEEIDKVGGMRKTKKECRHRQGTPGDIEELNDAMADEGPRRLRGWLRFNGV